MFSHVGMFFTDHDPQIEAYRGSASSRRVLIVDDDIQIVDLLEELLEDEGYLVERAYDGVSALVAIERDPPDLVLSDVMMPRLDGVGLAAEVRKRDMDIPIILMSAAVEARRVREPFLAKPFDIDVLLDLIGRHVEHAYHSNGSQNGANPRR